jgi:hypothetical protein
MSQKPEDGSFLTPDRSDEIAQAIAAYFISQNFRFMPENEYRRRIGQMPKQLGNGITKEELHQYILDQLPKILGTMFGWKSCTITGTRDDSQNPGNKVASGL